MKVVANLKTLLEKGLKKLIPFYGKSERTNASQVKPSISTTAELRSSAQKTAVKHPNNQPISQRQNTSLGIATKTNNALSEEVVTVERGDIERAIRAAHYLNEPSLGKALERLSAEQANKHSVTMTVKLHQEAEGARSLARLTLQNELAIKITPLARKLMNTAEQAGLATKKNGVKVFKGKQYAIRCQYSRGEEHVEVRCRQGQGYMHVINGKVQKAQGLQIKDRDRFTKFAAKSPEQLKQMITAKKKSAQAGISQ